MPTVPIFCESKNPFSHRIIFIIKTQSLLVDASGYRILNIFFRYKNGFLLSQKIGSVGTLLNLYGTNFS